MMRVRDILFTTVRRWEQGAMWSVGTIVVLLILILILLLVLLFREPVVTTVELNRAVRFQLKELLTKDPEVVVLFSKKDQRLDKLIDDVNVIIGERGNILAIVESIKECACPKKRHVAPRVSPKPVARPVKPPRVETRTFVPLLPNERLVLPPPPPPPREMPLGTKPRLECPPGRPSTAVTIERGEVCR